MAADAQVGGLPPGSVVITPTQMYAELRDMGGKVDHLVSVLDPALSNLRTDIAEVRTQSAAESVAIRVEASRHTTEVKLVTDDHESRLRAVEKRVIIASAAAVPIAAGLSRLIDFLGG